MKNNVRFAAAAVSALLLLGGRLPVSGVQPEGVAGAPRLTDLKGIDEFRSLFNSDVGKVRLALLLSPT